jgi:hypothetical protein
VVIDRNTFSLANGFTRWLFMAMLFAQFFPTASHGQISPGPLSKSHRQLEGLRSCTACHTLGKQVSDEKCLTCHVSIKGRIDQQRSFHAFAVARQNGKCVDCHKEHGGEDFALIYWEKGQANFDHTKTGFDLLGKHRALQCRDCHQQKFIREDFGEDKNVRPSKTFLGLQQSCVSCHADEHRGQLGEDCQRCHDNTAWKPAPQFSHDRAKFRLTGRHQQVACAQSHLEKAATTKVGNEKIAAFVQFTGLAFNNCTPCHRDPHRGGFGDNCSRCHSTIGWKEVPRNRFNHDLTDFSLRGKHTALACEKCHAGGNFAKKLAHQFCMDCHADAHAGQFLGRKSRGACEECHTVEGFSPATFTLAKHQQTRFSLAGAHLATPCMACHSRQSRRVGLLRGKLRFAFDDRRCQACHQDVHRGQFKKNGVTRCERCHEPAAWSQLLFVHNRDSSYKLDGAHINVACEKCHFQLQMKDGAEVVVYKPLRKECAACHR